MKPRLGIVTGDPCGIGPEIVAKLVAAADVRERAGILVISDQWVFERGRRVAAAAVDVQVVEDPGAVDLDTAPPTLLACSTVSETDVRTGEAFAAGGRSALETLTRALALARDNVIDAIVFAPLNKFALHQTGYGFSDELHWFADQLDCTSNFGELNVLGDLWTSRVTSHVPLSEVVPLITGDAIVAAVQLAHGALLSAGYASPRIGVAALNPHAGDGGLFGREEIDIIGPAVRAARDAGIDAQGPFAADTIFLRARDGDFDAIVTMYHDQGQIAMKLMGFDSGVTVQGGLPVPITTPAHGTAFDIAGQGRADVKAMRQAFFLAATMGENRRLAHSRAG